MALPLNPEYSLPEQQETSAKVGETLYDKFKKTSESALAFARSKIYSPRTRQIEVSEGVWTDVLSIAKPGLALIAGTGIIIGIAHIISYNNPQIINMRVDPPSPVDPNAWRARLNKPTPLELIKQSGAPTPIPADLLPSKTANFPELQVTVTIPYDPNEEGQYPFALPTASPTPFITFQPTPGPVIDAGGNFGGEQVNAGGR